jgi:uncharacterized protein involved in response to NO
MNMPHPKLPSHPIPRTPAARGVPHSGPAILFYGFRPFFLSAGIYAVVVMLLWIGALSGLWPVGGREGPVLWHAHEMLFGYTTAALAGFVLTAIPNWTGRLPVSGAPLGALVALWLAGRVTGVRPEAFGEIASATIDALFLPALAFVVAREVIAGNNRQNIRVAVGISILAALNLAFHIVVLGGGDPGVIVRGTVALYTLLISHIGGRIIPSFTRNYLVRQGATRLPAAMSNFDQLAILSTLVAGICWAVFPFGWPTTVACLVTAAAHFVRLARWQGQATWREPLLLVLQIGYGFVPLGYLAIALSSPDFFHRLRHCTY